ncbi:MAG: MFS transporter [Fibromonadaceae bacterium]|jgi:MFS family permease|nr:MFS transporter [Fibromonadaceae bacterium]
MSNKSILFVLCWASFLVPFMGSALTLALPKIGDEMGLSKVAMGWISSVFLMSTAVFQVPFAKLGDMFGRKRVFSGGLMLMGVAGLCNAFLSSGFKHIALFQALAGIGAAMIFGTNMAILTSVFPPEKRGKVMGILTSIVYLALATGPLFGGMLVHNFGWRSLFLITGLTLPLLSIYTIKFMQGEWREPYKGHFDFAGSAIYGLALFGLIFGFSGLPNIYACAWAAIGFLLFISFIFYELKKENPVFNVRMFSGNKTLGFSSFTAFISYASTAAVAFMLSLYLQTVRNFDAQLAGFVLISQALVQSVASFCAGRLSDKKNPIFLAATGMVFTTLGLLGLAFIGEQTPIWLVASFLALLGLGFGLFAPPNTKTIMGSVDKKFFGQASATIGTMRLTGQAISMGLAMMFISVAPNFIASVKITFGGFAVLCAIGAYATILGVRGVKR